MSGFDHYRNCHLCPRHCGTDRTAGERGVCGESSTCRIASSSPHFGEEPSFSGKRGSGTIFFTGCSCRCYYCQNHQISMSRLGQQVSRDELLSTAKDLIATGVHNLNFVTPDHFWPHIQWLCEALRHERYELPFIYNCSGYQNPDLIPDIAAAVDIFMPDFKHSAADLAVQCMNAADYPAVALAALQLMVAEKGFLEPFDPTGAETARTGVLVRHLVLPGHVQNSLDVLQLLRREFGRMLPLSIMSQFTPMPACHQRGSLTRQLTTDEYARVCEEVERLGFQQVYSQPTFEDTGFAPDFNRKQPFAGNDEPQRENTA